MKTRTAPWDYDRRYPAPSPDLFTTCPACGYKAAVKNGYVQNGPQKGSLIVNCYECNTLDQVVLSQEERTKKAACSICILAQVMRVCNVFAFGAYASQHNKPDPLEFTDDWAAGPEWVKSLDDAEETPKIDIGKMIADTEARYSEAFKHPARSDRSKYTQQTAYWNGDIL